VVRPLNVFAETAFAQALFPVPAKGWRAGKSVNIGLTSCAMVLYIFSFFKIIQGCKEKQNQGIYLPKAPERCPCLKKGAPIY
jgi:uncharacterized membrane protein YukC